MHELNDHNPPIRWELAASEDIVNTDGRRNEGTREEREQSLKMERAKKRRRHMELERGMKGGRRGVVTFLGSRNSNCSRRRKRRCPLYLLFCLSLLQML